MGKYKNINKYFNKITRFWIVFSCLLIEIFILGGIASQAKAARLYAIILGGYVIFIFGILYKVQLGLVGTYMGRDLRRRGFDLDVVLDEIDSELLSPKFAQIHSGVNSSMNFIITRNWIVGCGDLIAMRANAIPIRDIASVSMDDVRTRNTTAGYTQYFRLRIMDKNDNSFYFTLRNRTCQEEAYDYITENILNNME